MDLTCGYTVLLPWLLTTLEALNLAAKFESHGLLLSCEQNVTKDAIVPLIFILPRVLCDFPFYLKRLAMKRATPEDSITLSTRGTEY